MTRLQEVMAKNGYLSAMEVANLVGWHITTAYRKYAARELLCVQVGAKWFVNSASLELHLGCSSGMLLKGLAIPEEARGLALAFAEDPEGTLTKLAKYHASGVIAVAPAAPKKKVRTKYKNKVPLETPARCATSSARVAANPFSTNKSSAAASNSPGRASLRRSRLATAFFASMLLVSQRNRVGNDIYLND